MKKFFILQVSALLVLSACQPNSEFAKKNLDGSTFNISNPGEESSVPRDLEKNSGSCNEIASYMLCISSGCEPVLRTDKAEVAYSQEEELFSRCIPKPSVDSSGGEAPIVVILPPEIQEPKAGDPPKVNEPEGEEPSSGGEAPKIPEVVSKPGDVIDEPISGGEAPKIPEVVSKPGDVIEEPEGEAPKIPEVVSKPGDVIEEPEGEAPIKGPSDKPNKPGEVVDKPGSEGPKDPGAGKPGDVVGKPGSEGPKGPGAGKPGEVVGKPGSEGPKGPGAGKPAIPANCDGLIPGASAKSKGQSRVVICHNASSKSHTIEIACPALKAHTSHHLDTLGPCKDE